MTTWCWPADEEQSSKLPVLGNLSLQPLKEVVAIVTREASQRLSAAAERVLHEVQAGPPKDVEVSPAARALATSNGQQQEQLSSDTGPLEQGILKSGSLNLGNAVGKLLAEALDKPFQDAPSQGEQAADDANSLAIATILEGSLKTWSYQLDKEKEKEKDSHQGLTPANDTTAPLGGMSQGGSLEKDPLDRQQEMGEDKVETNHDGLEVELIAEINSLSEQAMAKTLVSQCDSTEPAGHQRH